jgi:HAD superfamily hydrolase (TIGR01490 family)
MENTFSGNQNPSSGYVAFFDLDHTLIRKNSGKTVFREVYRNKLLPKSQLIKAVLLTFLYKIRLRNPSKTIKSMVKWMQGIPVVAMDELAERYFREDLINSLYPEIISEINNHRSNGARIVMLSSAILPVCRIISEFLRFDSVICTGLEEKDGIYTGFPDGELCFGIEKAKRLKHYCNSLGLKSEHSWYYADSLQDIPAFHESGNPVCINPGRKLLKYARKNNWKVLVIS